MFKVYKYEIKSGEYQDLLMPKGAKILTVQVQGRSVCIWALVKVKKQPPDLTAGEFNRSE